MKEKCHICGSTEHMRNDCPRKVQPIITPISRMQNMTNLNDLFKRPVITMTSSNNKNDSATDQTNQNSGNNKTTNTATTSNTSTVTQVPVLSSTSTKTPTQAKNGLLQQQADQNESAEKYASDSVDDAMDFTNNETEEEKKSRRGRKKSKPKKSPPASGMVLRSRSVSSEGSVERGGNKKQKNEKNVLPIETIATNAMQVENISDNPKK
jgi:hypothetical protein